MVLEYSSSPVAAAVPQGSFIQNMREGLSAGQIPWHMFHHKFQPSFHTDQRQEWLKKSETFEATVRSRSKTILNHIKYLIALALDVK